MENEIYNPKEIIEFDECKIFTPENFKTDEFQRIKMEYYKVKEISATSKKIPKTKNKKYSSEIKNQTIKSKSSSLSLTATATPIVIIGLVGGAVIFNYIDINNSKDENIAITPIYGDFKFNNYYIDTFPYTNNEISNNLFDLTLNFDGKLKDGYICLASFNDNSDNSYQVMDNIIKITELEAKDYEINLTYLKDEEIINKELIKITYKDFLVINQDIYTAYKFTSNEDGTTNYYFYIEPLNDYKLQMRSFIGNDDGFNEINCINNGNYCLVPNITYDTYTINVNTYCEYEGNYYSYYSQGEYPFLNKNTLEVYLECLDDNLSVTFYEEIVNEAIITVTFEDSSTQEFIIEADQTTDYATINLSLNQINNNINVKVTADALLPNFDLENKITDYIGSETIKKTRQETLQVTRSSFISNSIVNSTILQNLINNDGNKVKFYSNNYLKNINSLYYSKDKTSKTNNIKGKYN